MPLWDKLQAEIDRAGRAAQGAVGEARIRLEAFRARQLADRAAQALGYAVHRRAQGDGRADDAQIQSLTLTLGGRIREADRLEAALQDALCRPRGRGTGPSARGPAPGATAGTAPGDPADTAEMPGAARPQGFV